MNKVTHEALTSLVDEVIKLKQELADLKAWATCATNVIQDMQESKDSDYLRLP